MHLIYFNKQKKENDKNESSVLNLGSVRNIGVEDFVNHLVISVKCLL